MKLFLFLKSIFLIQINIIFTLELYTIFLTNILLGVLYLDNIVLILTVTYQKHYVNQLPKLYRNVGIRKQV